MHEDTYGKHIEDLVKVHVLIFHLSVDTIDMLGTAADLSLDASPVQFLIEPGDYALDVAFACDTALFEQQGDALIGLWL